MISAFRDRVKMWLVLMNPYLRPRAACPCCGQAFPASQPCAWVAVFWTLFGVEVGDLSEVTEKRGDEESEDVRKELSRDREEEIDPCGVCEA
jgi:hypothetical protein